MSWKWTKVDESGWKCATTFDWTHVDGVDGDVVDEVDEVDELGDAVEVAK